MIFTIQLNRNKMKKILCLLAFLIVGVSYGQVSTDSIAKYFVFEGQVYSVSGGIGYGGTDDQTGAEVSYDNTSSGLTATTVQSALDENVVSISQNANDISNNAGAINENGLRIDSLNTIGITKTSRILLTANGTLTRSHLLDNANVWLDDAVYTIPNDSLEVGETVKINIAPSNFEQLRRPHAHASAARQHNHAVDVRLRHCQYPPDFLLRWWTHDCTVVLEAGHFQAALRMTQD